MVKMSNLMCHRLWCVIHFPKIALLTPLLKYYKNKLPILADKIGKKRKKSGKRGKNQEKRKNWEDCFTLPLLTDRAGYATGPFVVKIFVLNWCPVLNQPVTCSCRRHANWNISHYMFTYATKNVHLRQVNIDQFHYKDERDDIFLW